MNNCVWLKWGSLKGYHFEDDFIEKNKEIVEEFVNIWDEIYENCCSATRGSEVLQSNNVLKTKLLYILERLFNLGVVFQNDWDDTYYNSFNDIRDYIMNYDK